MPLKELVWHAFHLFSLPATAQSLDNGVFVTGLQALRRKAAKLKPLHLGLDEARIARLPQLGEHKVLYMSVVDHEHDEIEPVAEGEDPARVMTIAAFLVKPGGRLPLHDHPRMYGILKLLHGQLQVQAYSTVRCLETTPGHAIPRVLCRKDPLALLTPASEPLLLSKNHSDIHEICNASPDEMAIFLDILAPPYDFRRPGHSGADAQHCHRFCTYYKEVGPAAQNEISDAERTDNQSLVVLEEVPCPMDYATDHLQYSGPKLY